MQANRTSSGSGAATVETQQSGRCAACGSDAELNTNGLCTSCVGRAAVADSYGRDVALDLLQAAITQTLAYASPSDVLEAASDAIAAHQPA